MLLACLAAGPLQAQDSTVGTSPWSTFSPWSNIASPMGQPTWSHLSGYTTPLAQSPWSSYPSQYGSQLGNYWTGQTGQIAPLLQQPQRFLQSPYSSQVLSCQDMQEAFSFQPDLTGFWRGSGGESVEVQRNYARIWGGEEKPCNCMFFLVGQRLIAYSPDTDVVRKYWFQRGGSNQFTLIDESGNLMTYRRTR
jgi:hypothetical protein